MDILLSLNENFIYTTSSSVDLITSDQSQVDIELYIQSPSFLASIQVDQRFDCKLEGVYITEGESSPDIGGYLPLAWS